MKTLGKNNERGNVMVIVLLIVVLVVAAGAGYWVWHRNKSSNALSTKTSSSNSASRSSSQNSGSSSASTSSGTVSLAVACSDLSLSKGSSDGTAGTIYWHAVITNNGTHDCILAGYPAAFMNDGGGVSVAAESNALYPPVTVTLAASGGKAHVVIGLPDAGNFGPGTTTCTAAGSSKLRLYLPGLTSYIEKTFGEAACPGFSTTTLQPGV